MDTVKAKWNGSRRFVAWDEAGHGIVMDAKAEYGGDGSGVRPVELVLYGLAGCTAMDVISILEKKRQVARDAKLKVGAEELAKKLGGTSVTVSVRVHEGDKLYGSVGPVEICEKLAESGIQIDKTAVLLDEPIKALGVFHVSVRLHADVEAKVKVWVVKAAG